MEKQSFYNSIGVELIGGIYRNTICPITKKEVTTKREYYEAVLTNSLNYCVLLDDCCVYITKEGQLLRQGDFSEFEYLRKRIKEKIFISKSVFMNMNIESIQYIGYAYDKISDHETHVATVMVIQGKIKVLFDSVNWHGYAGAPGNLPLSMTKSYIYNAIEDVPFELKLIA